MSAGPTPPLPPPERNRRRWLFETIFEHDTRAGIVFDVLLLVVIVASILVVMLESVTAIEREHGALLRSLEWGLTALFTLEYVARLVSHPRPGVYARSFFGVVDLLAILPTYIAVVAPGAQAFIVVRMLRLLRVFRILKLVRFVREGRELSRALRASLPKIIVFLIAVLSLTTISGTVMYVIEGPSHGFTSIPVGVYWAVVTLTTVGYGDISPETPLGQSIASLIMIMGYGVIAVPTGIVSAELTRGAPVPTKLAGQSCTRCGSEDHERDALYCKLCGEGLHA